MGQGREQREARRKRQKQLQTPSLHLLSTSVSSHSFFLSCTIMVSKQRRIKNKAWTVLFGFASFALLLEKTAAELKSSLDRYMRELKTLQPH